ncbi:MAG: aldehyde dehydrogenase family protein [Geminicoccaceae bacterium]
MPESAAEAFAALRAEDDRHGPFPIEKRRDLLARLSDLMVERRERFVASIDADFGGRGREETLLAELLVIREAVRHARSRLRAWARPRPVGVTLPFWPSRAWIVPQALGVVGILSPWNYPIQLALSPMVGAIAAGNRVVLKPSELAPRTALELARLVHDAVGPTVARTVLGGPEVAAAFVRQPFDHLLFTGSSQRGREVMRAAAEQLTPLTLELGGKCPAIVMPDADLDRTAGEIVLGKALNAGQSCIAPDLVLVVGGRIDLLRDALHRAFQRYYRDGLATAPATDMQKARLARLTPSLEPLGFNGSGLSLAIRPEPSSPLLQEEIFGPILPLSDCPDLADALEFVRSMPSPLAVYLFTADRRIEARVLAATRAGALVVNGTILQAAIEALPFGGIGASGFGRYHGRAGFDTFSHQRVHVRAARRCLARLVEPPWNPRKRRLIDWLLGS